VFSVQRADEFLILFYFHHLTHKHVRRYRNIASRPFQVCTVCVNPLGSELPYISGTHSKSGGVEETKKQQKNWKDKRETTIRNHLKSKAVVIRLLGFFHFLFLFFFVCLFDSFLRDSAFIIRFLFCFQFFRLKAHGNANK
jgi:hypothetical protein